MKTLSEELRWASVEDFATLFQYFWYRDFPINQKSPGARRSDWTIHIGIVVRLISDLMGFMARFESGKRKDAVLRNTEQDIIALEWEWDEVGSEEVKANEIKKLKNHKLWSYDKDKERLLEYAVLITYTHARRHTQEMEEICNGVSKKWEGSRWPLLLIFVEIEKNTELTTRRQFNSIQMFMFSEGEKVTHTELRSAPALPWKVPRTRWSYDLKQQID
jgi:hypothetical protein